MLDYRFSKFGHATIRYDATELLMELKEAQDLEKKMAKKVKAEIRDKKRAAQREKLETNRQKIKERFWD